MRKAVLRKERGAAPDDWRMSSLRTAEVRGREHTCKSFAEIADVCQEQTAIALIDAILSAMGMYRQPSTWHGAIRGLMSHMKLLVAALVVLVTGISTAQAAPPRKAATSNGARFINPKEGQIFHPGETVSISVELDPKIEKQVKAIGIISSMGDLQLREAPPYSFTIAVPGKQPRGSSGSLIGFQELYLSGVLVGRERNNDDLATTTIDVEEPDPPVSLEVVLAPYNPFTIGSCSSAWVRTVASRFMPGFPMVTNLTLPIPAIFRFLPRIQRSHSLLISKPSYRLNAVRRASSSLTKLGTSKSKSSFLPLSRVGHQGSRSRRPSSISEMFVLMLLVNLSKSLSRITHRRRSISRDCSQWEAS
jgi:hypothetical protein